jgi:hypothetical protein
MAVVPVEQRHRCEHAIITIPTTDLNRQSQFRRENSFRESPLSLRRLKLNYNKLWLATNLGAYEIVACHEADR